MHARTRTLSCLILATGASLLGDAALYTVLPSAYASAGITIAMVGLVLSTNRLVRLFSNVLVGMASDRIGRRAPFAVGMALAVISTLAYGVSEGLYPLLAARVMWGIAWSLIAVSGHSMILDLSTNRDRGRLVGIYRGLTFLGGSLGMLFGGILSDALGFHRTFLLMGITTSVGFIASLGMTETNPKSLVERRPVKSISFHKNWLIPWRTAIERLRSLHSGLWIAAVLNLVERFFIGGVIVSTLGLYVSNRMSTWSTTSHLFVGAASLTGLLLFLRSLISVGSSPAFGLLSDLVKSRFLVILLGLLLGAMGYLLLARNTGILNVIAGILLAALAEGALATSLAARVGDMAPKNQRGAAVGLYSTFGDIGAGLAPLSAYSVASVWGLQPVYATCALVLLTCLMIVAWGARTKMLTD